MKTTFPTETVPVETVQEAYTRTVLALRDVGDALRPAVAVQYEAPPGFVAPPAPNGIPNPTLDIVADPRRLALSEEIKKTTDDLRRFAPLIAHHAERLRRATARWEGREESSS